MKSKNFETGFDLLANFVLTVEEMMSVRGGDDGDGDGGPDPVTPPPPVKI